MGCCASKIYKLYLSINNNTLASLEDYDYFVEHAALTYFNCLSVCENIVRNARPSTITKMIQRVAFSSEKLQVHVFNHYNNCLNHEQRLLILQLLNREKIAYRGYKRTTYVYIIMVFLRYLYINLQNDTANKQLCLNMFNIYYPHYLQLHYISEHCLQNYTNLNGLFNNEHFNDLIDLICQKDKEYIQNNLPDQYKNIEHESYEFLHETKYQFMYSKEHNDILLTKMEIKQENGRYIVT